MKKQTLSFNTVVLTTNSRTLKAYEQGRAARAGYLLGQQRKRAADKLTCYRHYEFGDAPEPPDHPALGGRVRYYMVNHRALGIRKKRSTITCIRNEIRENLTRTR